ncbi:MAG: M20/M25/M40 family metallo-hydrolase [Victivallales bacterium]|nr:M20/M25/M40 family metallo-hydrolase [Victivallales bacterium]
MSPSSLMLLEELCGIDSRTIEGRKGTKQVAELLAERLSALGFDDSQCIPPGHEEPSSGRHLRAVRNAGAPVRVVLVGHTDTVLSPTEVPFRHDARSARCYGAGVADMKGGCVVMLEAIHQALDRHGSVRAAEVTVLLNCSEEQPESSFPALLRQEAQGACACLTFEPSGVDGAGTHELVVARKGLGRFELACSGRGAHAGNAHATGINAIRELARKIEQIEALTDYERDLTANVGFVRGGQAVNQVPDEAMIGFEIRAFDPAGMGQLRQALMRLCSEGTVRSPADGGLPKLELRECGGYPPWPRNPDTDTLAERYSACAQRHGVTVRTVARGGASDASHTADLAPTLDGLGILGGGLHSTAEWADLSTLPIRATIAADFMADVCERASASDHKERA